VEMVFNIELVAETVDAGAVAPCELVDAGVNGVNGLLGDFIGVKAKGFEEAPAPLNGVENGFDVVCAEKGDCCTG